MSFAVIGDIHGDAVLLERMLHLLGSERRTLIFTGDYINRGSQSREVIALLLDLCIDQQDTILLWGNHERALADYVRTGNLRTMLPLGGIATIRSYVTQQSTNIHTAFLASFASSGQKFLSQLRRFHETDEFLVSHAGCDPQNPSDRSFEALVTGHHKALFTLNVSLPKLVICGHYVQQTRTPYVSDSVICVDTGCGSIGGPLTALILPEKRFISVSH